MKEKLFSSRHAVVVAVFFALVVTIPQLPSSNFAADDYMHLATLEGVSRIEEDIWLEPLDLYRFSDGNPESMKAFRDTGPAPWFVHPELKLAFWRPLSSLLAYLDHKIFGLHPIGYKIHSLLWYLALIAVLGTILRCVLPGSSALLALILFAVAACHREAVLWIASRNALITATIGMLALLAHIKWREEGWRIGRVLSIAGFATALLAGEAALGVFSYLAAYELFSASDKGKQRLKAILPALVVVFAWFIAYKSLGYGTHGSGAYMNPVSEPFAFLLALPARLLAMTGSLFLGFPADFWFLMPSFRPFMILSGVAAAAVLAVFIRLLWSGSSKKETGSYRWLLIGAVGALVPQAAGMLGPRSLLLPSIGGLAAVAIILNHWWTRLRRTSGIAARLRGSLCIVLVVIHLVLAPFLWFFWGQTYKKLGSRMSAVMSQSEIDFNRLPEQKLVFLTTPHVLIGFYAVYALQVRRQPVPKAWWMLSMAEYDHKVHRTAQDTLELEILDGRMMETAFEIVFRSHKFPLIKGEVVQLSGLTATVLEIDEVGPIRVEFKFDRSLDDTSLFFVAWIDGRLKHIQLPPVGQSLLLPWKPIM